MKHERQAARHEQVVAGFNLYRTPGVCETLDDVHVSTCYSGVVVEGPARVVAAGGHEVVLEVTGEQATALSHTSLAIVESPVHGTSFRASVAHLQPTRNEVSLSSFERFKDCIGRRRHSRVTPTHAMLVRLTCGEKEVFGRVVDISSGALAAVIDSRALTRLGSEDELLGLDVWGEPQSGQRLSDFSVSGRMKRVERRDAFNLPFRKVVVCFEVYPALEKILNRYVARRQREILVALERGVSRSSN